MDVENSIALTNICSSPQKDLLEYIEPLYAEDIYDFLGGNEPEQDIHNNIAQSIIDNRHTYFGWKDYMYCYMNVMQYDNITSVDYIVNAIVNYVSDKRMTLRASLETMIFLLYSTVVVSHDASTSGTNYSWRYFVGGTWINVDKAQMVNMVTSRMDESDVCNKLGVSADLFARTLRSIVRHSSLDVVGAKLYCPNFAFICDDKNKVFAMKSWTYDMKHFVVRRGLPSDISTLRSDIDIDIGDYESKIDKMHDVLRTWFPDDEVRNDYLNILSMSVSEFPHRFVVVNSGSGSDGKSTFAHIVKGVFGGYCAICPARGPMVDTMNSNDATPLANMLVGKRICITSDVRDVGALIRSPGFKGISGGDNVYNRRLHREASDIAPALKMLCIVNTNSTRSPMSIIAEMTRIRVVHFDTKLIDVSDRGIIPKHQLQGSRVGTKFFERQFLNEYGSCLLTEVILRHRRLKTSLRRVDTCDTIMRWTRDYIAPGTILSFLNACTEVICDANTLANGYSNEELVANKLSALYGDSYNDDTTTVEELFIAYTSWKKTTGKFTRDDPTNIMSFTEHLLFYHQVYVRDRDGAEEQYIKNIRLKPEREMFSIMYPRRHDARGGFFGGIGALMPDIGHTRKITNTKN